MTRLDKSGKIVDLALIRNKFASHGNRFHELWSNDSGFRKLCEDHAAALSAIQSCTGNPDLALQFNCIAVETELEIEERLNGKRDPSSP